MNRDHRDIGKQLGLFTFHEYAPGSAFWLPKGNFIYSLLSERIRQLNLENGYVEVKTPQLFKSDLFKQSGHWDHYKKNMFVFEDEDKQELALKPMNCPGHMLIYKSQQFSYRDLPYRVHDQGVLHRNESSGSLGGLTRCRNFCQDDAHLFVTEDQISQEIFNIINMAQKVYGAFNMPMKAWLSTRPKDFMGEVSVWNKAELLLEDSLRQSGISYEVASGDGAFYGPKIDFVITDSIGRPWQTATIQLDFQLPLKFDLKYVDSGNVERTPIVIHRAIYGSFERFIAILLEHYQGKLPVWMCPEQIRFLSITSDQAEYVNGMYERFKPYYRVGLDVDNNTLNQKILKAQLEAIPYVGVYGKREVESGMNVSLRDCSSGKSQVFTTLELSKKLEFESKPAF